MNFTPLTFVDTFDLAASLPAKMGMFGAGEDGLRQIVVRGPRPGGDPDDDLAFVRYKRAMWPEMKAMIERIKRIGDMAGGIEFGRITLDLLPAGTRLPWVVEDSEYSRRFMHSHLALRTNPGVITYAGPAAIHLPVGMLTLVPWSGIATATCNHGESGMIRLVVDTRKKDQAE